MNRHWNCPKVFVCLCCLSCGAPAAAAPSISDTLKPTPVQPGVDYDRPTADEQASCTVKAEKAGGVTAWVVRDGQGVILRQFADADGDNVVDTWSYFRGGLEVYRDIDENRNGVADQHRWFHGQGSRWGINVDEDKAGTIDRWKLISPEEAAEEVVEAVRTNNPKRFQALLLSHEELAKLGLSAAQSEQLAARIKQAPDTFQKLVDHKQAASDAQFTDFGGLKPGIVPAGTRGSTKDLMVYENVWAMIHQDDQHQQLQLGTIINFNGAWKLIDGPVLGTSKDVASGFFFGPTGGMGEAGAIATGAEPTEKMQKILADLEKLDQQLAAAPADQRAALQRQRADMLASLAEDAPTEQERIQWYKQLADSVSAATQDGSYPEGVDLLKEWEGRIAEWEEDDLLAYFQFQRMLAEYYGVTLAQEGVDAAKAQSDWLAALEAFLDEHPQSENAPEAIRQLAMASEIAGENEKAVAWYQRILDDFSQSVHAKMATGAITRLTSEGKTIRLSGPALEGGNVDLASLRGKAVVIQYWTTSCDVCTKDHELLGNLYKKYGGTALDIIGVNLDYRRNDVVEYLNEHRLPWKQLYEPGGFDGRLAADLGVITVPLIILVGPDGKVISSNIRAQEIEAELKKLAQSGAQATNSALKR
jgi:thiol-disulfide isomerase/thioredoxin